MGLAISDPEKFLKKEKTFECKHFRSRRMTVATCQQNIVATKEHVDTIHCDKSCPRFSTRIDREIKKQVKKKRIGNRSAGWKPKNNTERDQEIRSLNKLGVDRLKIAENYGLSYDRVTQIINFC